MSEYSIILKTAHNGEWLHMALPTEFGEWAAIQYSVNLYKNTSAFEVKLFRGSALISHLMPPE